MKAPLADPIILDQRRRLARIRELREMRELASGWMCPQCGKAHAPSVKTCPERPPLRDRIKIFNG